MIHINLLPVKAERRRENARIQVLVGLGVLAVALGALAVFHGFEATALSATRNERRRIEDRIAQLQRETGDYDSLKVQRENLLRQKQVIARLERARSGPAYFMRELSDILTLGKGPTFDHQQYEEALRRDPNVAINPRWDPKRLWLISYTEKDRQVQMHVGAKSSDDVAEFLKRLKLSAFFSSVYWKQTQPQVDSKLNVGYVTFDVDCRVNY